MMMNYTLCIMLFTKEAYDVVHSYIINVYSTFGGPHNILSDNGTEIKNKFSVQVASNLGMKHVSGYLYYL